MDILTVPTPFGPMSIAAEGEEIVRLSLPNEPAPGAPEGETPMLRRAREELLEYLDGRRRDFDLPLSPRGTPFQTSCWRALLDIPYGETRTYGQLAAAIGRPRAVRAVGQANHRNPIPILIPCHRVVGADGTLTGYGGGLELKAALLRLERGKE